MFAVFAALQESPLASAAGDKPPGVGPADTVVLPAPYDTPFKDKRSKPIGWPAGRTPVAPPGFRVKAFATNLDHPRQFYVLPNGDVLVAESQAASVNPPRKAVGDIILLRDTNQDGVAEVRETLLTGLNMPFGMLLLGKWLYVGNTDSVVRFPFQPGQTKITEPAEKVTDLGWGEGHYTRNLLANADGSKIYIAVGSSSNANENKAADKEPERAAVLEMNPDGSGKRIFASGLRNPVGIDWEPATHTLWAVVNERNFLGDDLVPDYFTSVREGKFYGWPYAYFGHHEDPTLKGQRPDLVEKSTMPDYALGAHVAPLGLVFYRGTSFPAGYRGGAFIGEHGSVHRSKFNGYKVLFLAFKNGKPSGDPQDFLTGFISDESTSEVFGRPVGLTVLRDGSLLLADDFGNVVWRVSYADATK